MKVMIVLGKEHDFTTLTPYLFALENADYLQPFLIHLDMKQNNLQQLLQGYTFLKTYNIPQLEKQDQEKKQVMLFLTKLIAKEQPDCLLVFGRTDHALLAAYTGFAKKLPIIYLYENIDTSTSASINEQLMWKLATYHFITQEEDKPSLLLKHIEEQNIFSIKKSLPDTLLSLPIAESIFLSH